ncbi:hypothetical protein LTR28_005105, partial [Elasticomyces elasticus]
MYAGYWKRFICYCLRVVESCKEDGERRDREEEEHREEEGEEEEEEEEEGEEESDEKGEASETERSVRWTRQREDTMTTRCAMHEDSFRGVASSLSLRGNCGIPSDTNGQKDLRWTHWSFIFQSVRVNPFDSALVHFCGILGIEEEMGRLRQANDYSYKLAGLVYCTRVIGAEALLPSAERERQDEEDVKFFLEKRRDFLAD